MERKPIPAEPNTFKNQMEESKDYKPRNNKSNNIEECKERVTKRMSSLKRSTSGTINGISNLVRKEPTSIEMDLVNS